MFANGLWIIVLEMFCAFGLGAFIIWWTWPRKKTPAQSQGDSKQQKDETK